MRTSAKLASGFQPASKRQTHVALLACTRGDPHYSDHCALLCITVRVCTQVAEMFDLDLKLASGLQPASKRQILSALLASLRDAHWAQALGCSPEPGFMIPISLGTAASGAVAPLHGYHIERAVAAAERRSALLHNCR